MIKSVLSFKELMKENLVILGGCVSCVKVASYTAVMVKFKDKYMLAWSIEHLPMLAREIRIMPTSNLSFPFLHLFYCCIVMTIGFAFFSSAIDRILMSGVSYQADSCIGNVTIYLETRSLTLLPR